MHTQNIRGVPEKYWTFMIINEILSNSKKIDATVDCNNEEEILYA